MQPGGRQARAAAAGASTSASIISHAAKSSRSRRPVKALLLPTSSLPLSASASLSPHPPTHEAGPLTVQYPWPMDYYKDRETVVYTMQSQAQGLQQLPGDIFNVPVRVDLLHRVVRWLRAMWRQGTHKTKRRGEVSGGGKKPWGQKGSGRARHGSIRSPIWVGGGAVHGPQPRSHAHKLPMVIQLLGYKCALSAKANEGRLKVVDSLVPESAGVGPDGVPRVKTKGTMLQLRALLAGMPHETALLVDCGEEALDGGQALRRGARNLPWVAIMPWQQLTVYHLLKHQALVITKPALLAMTHRLQQPPASLRPGERHRLAWWQQQQRSYQEVLKSLAAAQPAWGTRR
mmetsp:Transcript_4760/g.8268  ORF Transcript_4760/g.8268 Transcript_4760/m.8268 type:complete len:345 (-) Transcript_4760:413-1447(-)